MIFWRRLRLFGSCLLLCLPLFWCKLCCFWNLLEGETGSACVLTPLVPETTAAARRVSRFPGSCETLISSLSGGKAELRMRCFWLLCVEPRLQEAVRRLSFFPTKTCVESRLPVSSSRTQPRLKPLGVWASCQGQSPGSDIHWNRASGSQRPARSGV